MTINNIKSKLGYDSLTFCEVINLQGDKEDFVKHWDNDNRVAIIVNADLFHEIKKDPSRMDLEMNTFDKVSADKVDTDGNPVSGRPYTLVSIFQLKNVVGTI